MTQRITTKRLAATLVWSTVLALCSSCAGDVVERLSISPGSATSDAGPAEPVDPTDAASDAATDAADPGPDGCSGSCVPEQPPPCGDGNQAVEEECDDGNIVSGDGCDERCQTERCGNRRVDANEECDPPADLCDAMCKRVLPNCGDGQLQSAEGEQCDDANEARGDGCHTCRFECGNGLLERSIGEECEPLSALEGTCDEQTCKRLPACGNGKVEASIGETCDPSDGVTCVNCAIREPLPVDGGVDAGTTCVPLPLPVIEARNGTFDVDVAQWIARTRITTERAAEGGVAPGSLRTTFAPLEGGDSGYEVSGAYQCISVTPGAAFVIGIQFRIPDSNAAEVMPGLTLREYQNADCTGASTPLSAPILGSMRGAWIAREGTVTVGPTARALFLQLSVIKPRNVQGVVLWDDVTLESSAGGARCGNCVVDQAQGESCDDGNRDEGDGCDDACHLEGCGDGIVSPSEACDDGAQLFGDATDTCTPSCRAKSACDACAVASCEAAIDPCLNLAGAAAAGPARGVGRAALCDALRNCAHETGCSGDTAISAGNGFGEGSFLENCYCGTAGQDCFERGEANGSCRAEVEAALETTDPVEIFARVGGAEPEHPSFAALSELLACERMQCSADCVTVPACGDGLKQDRTAAFAASYQFHIGTMNVACDDALTHTGSGCSFEECDDGNTEGSDGCDADCFVEVCGNNIRQGEEDCDDGNTVAGDGCDGACVAEYVCGDGTRDERFEECDPPGSGIVCSQAEFEANPAQCACDSDCRRVVCGNDVEQEGEDCDPPGPVCSDRCEELVDECTSCVGLIEFGASGSRSCSGDAWLDGIDSFPGFEQGCRNNEACFNLWSCYRSTLCHLDAPGPHTCYCGPVAGDVCEQGSYQANGPCKDEILEAFEEQFQYSPQNSDVTTGLTSLSVIGPYAALYVPHDLATFCLQPDVGGLDVPLRTLLSDNGVTGTQLDECVEACFPTEP